VHGEWRISFRRSFGADELADRDALMRVIYAVCPYNKKKKMWSNGNWRAQELTLQSRCTECLPLGVSTVKD